MKKIFIVLFLILAVSAPAFAKQKAEPDWIPLITGQDGTEWFYDVNSVKKVLGDPSYKIDVKNFKDGRSKINNYWIACHSYGPRYAVRNKYWAYSNEGPIREGHVSGYLYNEFCRGK